MTKLTRAPSTTDFTKTWTRGFAKAVRAEAGNDGRLTLDEAKKLAAQDGPAAMYGDNAVNYLEKTGQKSVDVDKLVGSAHRYVENAASNIAGPNQRISLLEARSLPDDLRGDFFALRGKPEPGAVSTPTRLTGISLKKAIQQAVVDDKGENFYHISESDAPLLPSFVKNPRNLPPTGNTVLKLFKATLGDIFKDDNVDLKNLTSETMSASETKAWLSEKASIDPDEEDYYVTMGTGFKTVQTVLDENLDDVRLIRVGPKADDGSLEKDAGTYGIFILGKNDASDLAGIHFSTVET